MSSLITQEQLAEYFADGGQDLAFIEYAADGVTIEDISSDSQNVSEAYPARGDGLEVESSPRPEREHKPTSFDEIELEHFKMPQSPACLKDKLPAYSKEQAKEKLETYNQLYALLRQNLFSKPEVISACFSLSKIACKRTAELRQVFKLAPKEQVRFKGRLSQSLNMYGARIESMRAEVVAWEARGEVPLEVKERHDAVYLRLGRFFNILPFKKEFLQYLAEQAPKERKDELGSILAAAKALKKEIVFHNLRYLRLIALKTDYPGFETDDVFQLSAVYLDKIIDNFDPELGVSFAHYARVSITTNLQRDLSKQYLGGTVASAAHRQAKDALRIIEKVRREEGYELDDRELAKLLGVKKTEIPKLRLLIDRQKDTYLTSETESQLSTDRRAQNRLIVDGYSLEDCLLVAAKILSRRKFEMVERHYIFGETQNKIARSYGTSKQAVNQMLDRCLEAVRYELTRMRDRFEFESKSWFQDKSYLFDFFIGELEASSGGCDGTKMIEKYAGDTEFWRNFFDTSRGRVPLFRHKLGKRGFDLERLSPERREIFLAFFRQRFPNLESVGKDRMLSTLLGVPREVSAIRRELVKRGWLKGDVTPQKKHGSERSLKEAYVRDVSLEQKNKNIDAFIQANYPDLDSFQKDGPSVKLLAEHVGCKPWEMEKLAAFAAREGGPLSQVMPEGAKPLRAKKLSFYFRREVVGEAMAYANAKNWVKRNIPHIGAYKKTDFRVLRTLLESTDYIGRHTSGELSSPAQVGAELVKRGWTSPFLDRYNPQVKGLKSMACDIAVVQSEDARRYNIAVIKGEELPVVEQGTDSD